MNFSYNEEQEKILLEAIKSACEFGDKLNKLTPEYRQKLFYTLIGYNPLKNFIDSKGNFNDYSRNCF